MSLVLALPLLQGQPAGWGLGGRATSALWRNQRA